MNAPFCIIKFYKAGDVPEYRAHFRKDALGSVIIRLIGTREQWVWTTLFQAVGVMYVISETVELSHDETMMLAQEA